MAAAKPALSDATEHLAEAPGPETDGENQPRPALPLGAFSPSLSESTDAGAAADRGSGSEHPAPPAHRPFLAPTVLLPPPSPLLLPEDADAARGPLAPAPAYNKAATSEVTEPLGSPRPTLSSLLLPRGGVGCKNRRSRQRPARACY